MIIVRLGDFIGFCFFIAIFSTSVHAMDVPESPSPTRKKMENLPLVKHKFATRDENFGSLDKMKPYDVFIASALFNASVNAIVGETFALRQKIDVKMSDVLKYLPKHIEKDPLEIMMTISLKIPDFRDDFYDSPISISDGNVIAIAGGRQVYLYNANVVSKKVKRLPDIERIDKNGKITSLSWFDSGNKLVVGTDTGEFYIWKMKEKVWTRKGAHSARINVITPLSYDSSVLFTSPHSGKFTVWDASTDEPKIIINYVFAHAPHSICNLVVSPDKKFIITGGNDNQVKVWKLDDLNSVTLHWDLGDVHKAAVKAIAWHPSGRYFATGGGTADRQLRIWDFENQTLIASKDVEAQITSIVWCKDKLFCSTGFFNCFLLLFSFDVERGLLEMETSSTKNSGRLLAAKALKKPFRIVTLDSSKNLKIWHVHKKKEKENCEFQHNDNIR